MLKCWVIREVDGCELNENLADFSTIDSENNVADQELDFLVYRKPSRTKG